MSRPARMTFISLSLLLCVLFFLESLASYVVPVGLTNDHNFCDSESSSWGRDLTSFGISDGRLYLLHVLIMRTDPWPPVSDHPNRRFGADVGRYYRTWLPYMRTKQVVPSHMALETQWTVPLWLLVPVFAILPIRYAVLQQRETRRNATAVCVRCGYDLRASRNRCPECGEAIPDPA